MNDVNLCLLVIATYEYNPTDNNPDGNVVTRLRYHFYTYHLTENGIIGKMYDSEYGVIENAVYIEDNLYLLLKVRVGSANLRCDRFAISYLYEADYKYNMTYIKILKVNTIGTTDETINMSITLSGATTSFYVGDYLNLNYQDYRNNLSRIYFTPNDDYAYSQGYSGRMPVVHLDNNYNIDKITGYNIQTTSSYIGGGDGEDIIIPYVEKNIAIYTSQFTEEFIIMTINADKSFSISKTLKYQNKLNESRVVHAEIDPENEKLIIFFVGGSHVYNSTTTGIEVLDISNIENWEDGMNIKSSGKILQSSQYSSIQGLKWYASNQNKSLILSNGSSRFFRSEVATDLENIVGIIYNENKYYRLKSGDLSATPSDVATGKTFIGNAGQIETGTMEVE